MITNPTPGNPSEYPDLPPEAVEAMTAIGNLVAERAVLAVREAEALIGRAYTSAELAQIQGGIEAGMVLTLDAVRDLGFLSIPGV